MSIASAIKGSSPADGGISVTNVGRWVLWGTCGLTILWTITIYAALISGTSVEAFFAPINTLVSGLALLGVLIALVLQRQEMEAQRREFAASRLAHEQIAADSQRRFEFERALLDEQIKAAADQKRKETTFSMHREFNSESLHESRNLAGGILAEHPRLSLDELHRILPLDQSVHFSNVTGFYNRLALLIKYDQIDKEYVPELFGRLFVWWWVNLFEGRTSPEWENVDRIKDLQRFIQENAAKENYQQWVTMAESARKRHLDAADRAASGLMEN